VEESDMVVGVFNLAEVDNIGTSRNMAVNQSVEVVVTIQVAGVQVNAVPLHVAVGNIQVSDFHNNSSSNLMVLMDTVKGLNLTAQALSLYSPEQLGQLQADGKDGRSSKEDDAKYSFQHRGYSFQAVMPTPGLLEIGIMWIIDGHKNSRSMEK
jgi:hypothetical protein